MAERAQEMAESQDFGAGNGTRKAVLERHSYLSAEQQEAVRSLPVKKSIEALTGFARGQQVSGHRRRPAIRGKRKVIRVLGAALSGIAAENLQRESGVESRTLASWEKTWETDRGRLGKRDVLVIDEAGMVGSRQPGGLFRRSR